MAVTLEQLLAFVETVDKGSFKQASIKLGKHTSTVSGLIANLEAELGMELFVRKPRSLEITPQASEMYRYAQSVIRECDLLDVKANSIIEGHPSSFTIAVDSDLMGPDIGAICARLLTKYPTLDLKLVSTDPMQVRSQVLTEQADIGFGVALFSGHHELTLADGYSFDVVFAASPELGLNKKLIDLTQIRGQLQISALFMKQTGREDTHNLSSRVVYSNSLHSTLDLLKQIPGWAMLPGFMCREAFKNGTLDEIYLSPTATEKPNQWATEICWLTAKPRHEVMDFVIQELGKLESPNR
ncbi:LysR family transcriptional regulator [Paraferrimonas sedimenticola]|uniref:LysR family transcriptional regulator n=1 Tax=Paraferrimonas sedimenticola TaxID=375674 RepID=A0AA37RTP0_9GAMM|nr:LysR family transcriptional regulator [Paraferrimonas sedimenticola]GLP95446.1 LysR family transcriptional regulator [Paraferrimonas sedimenticola]